MIVFAHRANKFGIDLSNENSFESIESCFAKGLNVETDIRRNKCGEFYISHDVCKHTHLNDAKRFCKLVRHFPNARIALNIKEIGYEKELLKFLADQEIINQVFLFDMELVEEIPGQTASIFHKLHPDILLAARISDRNEPISRAVNIKCAKIIWADEFDKLWINSDLVIRVQEMGKFICIISPEIHGFTLKDAKIRWKKFIEWGVDGICTDYPVELNRMINHENLRTLDIDIE
jgi:glycerophosphoryl diester phosphodiesterase